MVSTSVRNRANFFSDGITSCDGTDERSITTTEHSVFGAATTLCVVKPIVNLAHAKIIEQESILVKFGKRVLPTTDFLAKKSHRLVRVSCC